MRKIAISLVLIFGLLTNLQADKTDEQKIYDLINQYWAIGLKVKYNGISYASEDIKAMQKLCYDGTKKTAIKEIAYIRHKIKNEKLENIENDKTLDMTPALKIYKIKKPYYKRDKYYEVLYAYYKFQHKGYKYPNKAYNYFSPMKAYVIPKKVNGKVEWFLH